MQTWLWYNTECFLLGILHDNYSIKSNFIEYYNCTGSVL